MCVGVVGHVHGVDTNGVMNCKVVTPNDKQSGYVLSMMCLHTYLAVSVSFCRLALNIANTFFACEW